MNNTIVNIIDREDPLPLYLFIHERYQKGDKLLFVAGKGDSSRINFFVRLLGIDSSLVERIVFDNDAEEYTYELICRRIIGVLKPDVHYLVNLAGGSRYMALAVQRSFARFDSEFFYVQTRENLIVNTIFDDSIYDNDDIVTVINHRMTVKELLDVNGLENDSDGQHHLPIRSAEYTKFFYEMFVGNRLSANDYQAIALLRTHYRNRKGDSDIVAMAQTGLSHRPPVGHLVDFLEHIRFVPKNKGKLSHEEIDYLTGGWFEEYVYFMVKASVDPDDIVIGVYISRDGVAHNNELDVVFSKNNQLYVIECKTGVDSTRMFNEIVYKACALREVLLGTTCKSYIFSLIRDNDGHLHQVARLMGVRLYDRDDIVNRPPFVGKAPRS